VIEVIGSVTYFDGHVDDLLAVGWTIDDKPVTNAPLLVRDRRTGKTCYVPEENVTVELTAEPRPLRMITADHPVIETDNPTTQDHTA